ncbi:outer membrane beta-barrel protein [uncultured Shewanella sp.]|uniref:outer membrane beta-barrel protein n=1 Tax=uncultured Shewanella sp. TaxID=173975 RepID=UPI0026322DF0|nr:outer membrane beta-barrel protein [uncultured Shewanella sp.]
MKYIFLIIMLLVSSLTTAEELIDESHHVISLGGGLGVSRWAEAHGFDEEILNLKHHYEVAYRYQFNPSWGSEIGYMYQKITGSFILSPLTSAYVDKVSSFRLAVVYSQPLSQRSSFLFKLGVAQYNVIANLRYDDEHVDTDNEGIGALTSLGWRYNFASNYEFSLVYTYQKFDTNTVTANFGYRF